MYGLREVAGQRKSLFDYFLGRSKLTTWLHAILAQRHIDDIRRTRKPNRSMTTANSQAGPRSSPNPNPLPSDPERERYLAMLQACLTVALAALIRAIACAWPIIMWKSSLSRRSANSLGEHEATVSRKLERHAPSCGMVEVALRSEKKLSDAQLRRCLNTRVNNGLLI